MGTSYEPTDIEELAFAELVAFIDESLQVEEPAVLKLSVVGFSQHISISRQTRQCF